MKITPIKALNDNYIWMIQEGNHSACVDPSDATPVLKFLVHNRLMLAQTWITHPHPDHTGGAKSLFHGFLESPIYGESDIDVATHTVTAGTQFPFGESLGTGLATPRPPRAAPLWPARRRAPRDDLLHGLLARQGSTPAPLRQHRRRPGVGGTMSASLAIRVLLLIARGLSNSEIEVELGITRATRPTPLTPPPALPTHSTWVS